jgi:hypothetical protein
VPETRLDVVCETHRPRTVVVGLQIRIGIVLLFEQRFRKAAVWLIQFDDVRAGGERSLFDFHFRRRAMHFDCLTTEQIRDAIHLRLIALTGRNHKRMRRLLRARVHRVHRFAIEVLDHHLRECGCELERRQHARLAVIDRVANRPINFARWRGIRTEPLTLRLRSRKARLLRVRASLVEDFVHPDHPVVIARGKRQISG